MNETTQLPLIRADLDDELGFRALYGEKILGVSQPGNIDELQALVLEAERGRFGLHVHGFGLPGTQRLDNVIVVDLGRMNRIIEVNTKSAYALVEPGVSFLQLYRYLQDNDTGLWIDCARNAMHSVAGSIASHSFAYTPYGDHLMMQCGAEVMLADGQRVRLGMGALPGANTWQLAKYAYGPYIDGLFTQSTFGIITKIGVWLMPAPPACRPFMLSLRNDEDIAEAVEILRPLKHNVIIPNSVVIAAAALDVAPFARRENFVTDSGLDIVKIKSTHDLGEWNLYGALYNTPENVELLWPMVSEALGSIEGARLYTDTDRNDDPVWSAREGLMRGVPVEGYDNMNSWGGDYRCDIAIACPADGTAVLELNTIVRAVLNKHDMDDLCEYVALWRSLLRRNYLVFDGTRIVQVQDCVDEIISEAWKRGYRLTHQWTNHPRLEFHHRVNEGMQVLEQQLKKALDPAHRFY